MKGGIFCDTEAHLVSNERDEEMWNAFQQLLQLLTTKSSLAGPEILLAWKQPGHLAIAKEPYAWRAVLDALKDSDLSALCQDYRAKKEYVLMTDKPTMLKIGGEITNSLMHSYTSKHKISFRQIESKEPSFLAL